MKLTVQKIILGVKFCTVLKWCPKCPKFRSKKKDLVNDILPFIADGSLDTPAKLDAAINYSQRSEFVKSDFVKECGVGLKITGEDIENAVSTALKSHSADLKKQRYRFNVGMLLGKAR